MKYLLYFLLFTTYCFAQEVIIIQRGSGTPNPPVEIQYYLVSSEGDTLLSSEGDTLITIQNELVYENTNNNNDSFAVLNVCTDPQCWANKRKRDFGIRKSTYVFTIV
jgi:hypothetical protein